MVPLDLAATYGLGGVGLALVAVTLGDGFGDVGAFDATPVSAFAGVRVGAPHLPGADAVWPERGAELVASQPAVDVRAKSGEPVDEGLHPNLRLAGRDDGEDVVQERVTPVGRWFGGFAGRVPGEGAGRHPGGACPV